LHIAKQAIRRPVTVMVGVLIVIILGIISLTRIPIDLYPAMDIPMVSVSTSYSGVGPEEMETLVTKPIESAISTVAGIQTINSTSGQGNSRVTAQFDYGVNIDQAMNEMQQKIDRIKRKLPADADSPTIMKYDPNSSPILNLAISANMDSVQLKSFVVNQIQPALEKLDGVASVDVSGGLDREIQILVNPDKLQQYGLTLDNLSQQLKNQNLDAPGGTLKEGGTSYTIRTLGKFTSIDDIRGISIPLPGSGYITLGDVAVIQDGFKDVTVETKMNGTPSISISVMKQSGSNTVAVADGVLQMLDSLKPTLPANAAITTISDQSKFIKSSINTLTHDTLVGGLLAIVIILLFLKSINNTFIISTAIPIAVVATFVLMYFSNMSINIMSLGGLTLGVGMIVDDAIVVLENVYRHREKGLSSMEAAYTGTKEVSLPVIASTITTVAVFLPIVFVQGVTAQLFKDMAITVSFSLLVSLIVSLTLTPMLSSKWISVRAPRHKVSDNVEEDLAHEAKWVLTYRKMLGWALGHRKTVVLVGVATLAAAVAISPLIGTEFMPSSDQGEININIQMPTGSELEKTRDVVSQANQIITKIPEVQTVFSSVGSGNATRTFGGGSTDVGSFNLRLVDLSKRKRSTALVVEELQQKLNRFPGVKIRVNEASSNSLPGLGGGGGGGGGGAISYSIRGDDDQTLEKLATQLTDRISQIKGVRQADNSLSQTSPELQIKLDRVKAGNMGITPSTISNLVQGAIQGQTATTYEVSGDEVDVTVKYEQDRVQFLKDLEQIWITSPKGEKVQLSEIASLDVGNGPKQISRYNQARVVTVSAGTAPGADLGTVTNQINQLISNFPLPPGYSIEQGGQNKQMKDSFSGLIFAFLLAIVLVYLILSAQFESFVYPLSIMLSVPLSFFGAALSLFLTGRTFSVSAYIGIILLAGIVVRNAIVLVDFTNVLRTQGLDRTKALLVAGPIRLRPIIMTTLCTSLGLLPLALGIGEGGDSQAPMATVVIGGLLFSTLLTLVVIPVVYTILDDATSKFQKFNPFKRLKRKKMDTDVVNLEN
jgi:hydrophobic/amphiphilic exporter-1 (mainly G- bacteria), HAE1 family